MGWLALRVKGVKTIPVGPTRKLAILEYYMGWLALRVKGVKTIPVGPTRKLAILAS